MEFIPWPLYFGQAVVSYGEYVPVGPPTYDVNVQVDGMPFGAFTLSVGKPPYRPRVAGQRLPDIMTDEQTITWDFSPKLTGFAVLEWSGMLRPKTI